MQATLTYLAAAQGNPLALLKQMYPSEITVRVNPSMGEILTECNKLAAGQLEDATVRALTIREYRRAHNEFMALRKELSDVIYAQNQIRALNVGKFANPASAERLAKLEAQHARVVRDIDVAVRENQLESAEALEEHLSARMQA